jgi:hypothetical protein
MKKRRKKRFRINAGGHRDAKGAEKSGGGKFATHGYCWDQLKVCTG